MTATTNHPDAVAARELVRRLVAEGWSQREAAMLLVLSGRIYAAFPDPWEFTGGTMALMRLMVSQVNAVVADLNDRA